MLAPTTEPETTTEWAHRYAALGWRVLPVNGKKPTIKNWPTAASTDPSKISTWFKTKQNIGIATGHGSNLVVIDIDPRNGGDLSFKRLERELGPLPKTTTAITGGGGLHFIFKNFTGSRSIILADGIDFLADSKMFVACPSIHPTTQAVYRWKYSPWDIVPQELPASWQEQLAQKKTTHTNPKIPTETGTGPITHGSRNTTLCSIAGQLFASGTPKNAVQIHLLEENQLRCVPPLDPDEIAEIVNSVSQYYPGNKSIKTQWQDAVFEDQTMPANRKLTLLALARYANQHGRSCFPTQEMVAANAALTRKTVAGHIQVAIEEKWITVYQRNRPEGHGYNYGYILNIDV